LLLFEQARFFRRFWLGSKTRRWSKAAGGGLIEDGRLMPESERLASHFRSLVADATA
jgi:hypothetical protein